jgi:hypothetical protein
MSPVTSKISKGSHIPTYGTGTNPVFLRDKTFHNADKTCEFIIRFLEVAWGIVWKAGPKIACLRWGD